MKNITLLILGVCCTSIVLSQNLEQKYTVHTDSPEWIKRMYSNSPNVKQVKKGYEDYYQSHEFVKNQHTQYYKRFLRKYEQFTDSNGDLLEQDLNELGDQEYKQQLVESGRFIPSKAPGNWGELGPWEYDHEAALHLGTQSPGSAHVYTVEQSVSNPDVVYAGTASAGVWKSVNKGLSWDLVTRDLLINNVQAIAIDPMDENMVYFGFDNKIAKSTDGGISWSLSTDIGYSKDIKIHPTNSNVLICATTWGVYRSSDFGVSWSPVLSGYFYEIEFHSTDPSVVYCIRSKGGNTVFYKSIDTGLSFLPKYNGWPGIGSVQNLSLNAIDPPGSDYGTLASSLVLGDASTPDFTIEMKIKSSGWSGDPAILSNKSWASGVNKGFVLFGTTGGGIGFNIGDGSSRIDLGTSGINDNEWHNVSMSYQASGVKKIYVDGVVEGSNTSTISFGVDAGLATAIYQDGTLGYGFNFPGMIGEIRIFDVALDSATIAANHCVVADVSHPNYSDLLHLYTLQTGSGSTLNDAVSSNNITLIGTPVWTNGLPVACPTLSYAIDEEQKRTEIAVSQDNPDLVIALATGDVGGGSGLVGIYKSIDAGESFTFECCGMNPGEPADANNKNIVGYSGDLDGSGGQYYYDLALDISPTDADRILVGGIMVVKSIDGGVNWERNNHWVTWGQTSAELERYVHADVHDIKFFHNGSSTDLWIASDGGLYYSSNQGDTIEPRMHGIQGTEFWGFGSSSIGDGMIGGAYHNGTLRHYENVYLKGKNGYGGWFAGGAGDAGDGYIHEAYPDVFFDYGGMKQFPADRLSNPVSLPYDESKIPSYHAQSFSNYEWIPNQYEDYYIAIDANLWKTNSDGVSWELVSNFITGKIYDVRTTQDNQDVIYLVHQTSARKYVKKSVDGGQNWTDITPPDALVGAIYNSNDAKSIDVNQSDQNEIWCVIRTSHNIPKVLHTTDGGTNWLNITGAALGSQLLRSLSHQQGTDGGIYVGTTNAIYYKNNSMSDFVLHNDGLPVTTSVNFQYPNYTFQKLRIASYRGAYEGDFFEPSQPLAKPSVDKIEVHCLRDTVYFKDLSFVSDDSPTRLWSFPGGTPSSSTDENPKVVYTSSGSYDITLTVTDINGASAKTLSNFITISNECSADSIPGNALFLSSGVDGAYSSYPINFGTSDFSLSCWIKTTSTVNDMAIVTDKNWDSGYNKGWVLAMNSGNIVFNIGDGLTREDLWSGAGYNDGVWHYISISVDRSDSVRLFVDGFLKSADNVSGIGDIFDNELLFMGVDVHGDYPFEGQLDELKIWNSVKTQDFFREQRHLTAVPANDADLVAYYQFNRLDDEILDRVGANHSSYLDSISNVSSTAPLGGGVSDRVLVNSGGLHDFLNAKLQLTFPSTGTYPDGELVGSKIHVSADTIPVENKPSTSYWIIDNYGPNQSVSVLEELTFVEIDTVHLSHVGYPQSFQLFQRGENSEGDWGVLIGESNAVVLGTPGEVSFSSFIGLAEFGQFYVVDTLEYVTSIDEGGKGSTILVYPTVSNGESINIALVQNTPHEHVSLYVHDTFGKLLCQKDLEQGLNNFNLQLSSGMYFLHFVHEGRKLETKKIIIK